MPLPSLPSGFRWTDQPWGPALVSAPLAEVADHLFTTRGLTLRVGADARPDDEGWTQLAASMGVDESRLLRLRQVHGRDVVHVRKGEARVQVDPALEADALVADDPAAALVIRGADCVPILFADARTGAVAAAHAGWRGTALGTAVAAVNAMQASFGSRPADLVAVFGPSIGPCCYQVGEGLRASFAGAGHAPASIDRWFVRDGDLRLDLWTANAEQLEAAGIPASRIHVSRLCTACHLEQCFSYRKEGEGTGRLAGVIRARG